NLRGADKLWLDDPRWGMAGFGPQTEFLGERASLVEGAEAVFVVPLRRPAPLRASLWLAPASPGAHVVLELGGTVVLDARLREGWQELEFVVPAAALAAGFNYVKVRQSFAAEPVLAQEVGSTGLLTALEVTLTSDAGREGGLA